MKRLPGILALLGFLALGSGGLAYLHEMEHVAEDARLDAMARAAGLPPVPSHHHDESNCDTCAQLHVLFTCTAWVPLLICLGIFVAFLSMLDAPLIPRLVPARIDCRGPPGLFPSF